MLNATILERYEIKKQVRENELFTEYWGEDVKMGGNVTAVVIRAASAADFFARFEPVNKKFAGIHSPCAPALIEWGAVDGQAALIRPYVEGETLRGMLAGGNLPLDLVLDVAQQLGEYLDLLHQAGLTQIAFELEDVFIPAGGDALVTNFGVAQGVDLGGLLTAKKVSNRIAYAPELAKGGTPDARADFYSLGALLFEALTGKKPPLDFDAAGKTFAAEDFYPSRLRMGISPEWDALISKCLNPAPARRIQSAAEFLHQVDEIRRSMNTVAANTPLSMEDSLVGQTLGSYRLVSRLGQGGMATVYKAYEPALDRYVAVKVLPQFFAKDPIFVQRFKREAKAVAQLNHPNIVPIYSYGETNGVTYIAMQFVVGDTLKHEGQKFAFEESLRLLIPIARALGYAHQRGVVHRDVKPSNILIAEESGWPLLADFGLAQMAQVSGKLTESGVGMGTPTYMSPEQGQGEKVDQRTDIYSLGIVLYELATGDVPFRADTPMAIVIKHISAPMPMPSKVNPDIPDYFEALILKATAKNPDDRYQTAEEMVRAMENALARLSSSEPVARIPTPPVETPPTRTVTAPVTPQAKPPEPATYPTASVVVLQGVGSFFKGLFRFVAFLVILGLLLPVLIIGGMAAFKICPPQGPWPQPPWCAGSSFTFDDQPAVPSTPAPPALTDPEFAPSQALVTLDDFEDETYWGTAFDDGANTKLDCKVDDSHSLRASNYLSFQFDVAAHTWATCGFDYDEPQNWQNAKGLAFHLRADQAGMPYEIAIFDAADHTYLYQARTPHTSANEWTLVEIPWTELRRVEWEDRAGEQIDPAQVAAFRLQIVAGEANQTGKLWIDDLSLLQTHPAKIHPNLFSDNFERPAWTQLESYVQEDTDTRADCVLDQSADPNNAFSLKFEFDVAPDAWASCGFSFDSMRDWRAGKGIGFHVRSNKADLSYYVTIIASPADMDQNYVYEAKTSAEALTGWTWVEVPWDAFRGAEWEAQAGKPLDPFAVIGLWFEADAPSDARHSGAIWIDDIQTLP